MTAGTSGQAMLTLTHNRSPTGLYLASAMMGSAYGVTNAYSTSLWEYVETKIEDSASRS
jgi:hypothetical protein